MTWAVNLIWANALVAGVDLLVQVQGFGTIRRAMGDGGDISGLDTYDSVSTVVGSVQLFLLVAAGIAFLLWWHRSLVNLDGAGQSVSATPRWAVGMWFVPIVSLFLPYRIVREAATDAGGLQAPNLPLWWGAWLTGALSTNVANRLGRVAETLTQNQGVVLLYALGDLATVVAAVLLVPIMRFIQRRQDHLARPLNTSFTPTRS